MNIDPTGEWFWVAVGAIIVGAATYALGRQFKLSGWKLALVTAIGAALGGILGHYITPLLKPVMHIFVNWGKAIGAVSKLAGFKIMFHWDHHGKGYHIVLQKLTEFGNWRTLFEKGFFKK